jgi:hypothetical protein
MQTTGEMSDGEVFSPQQPEAPQECISQHSSVLYLRVSQDDRRRGLVALYAMRSTIIVVDGSFWYNSGKHEESPRQGQQARTFKTQ